MLVGDFLFVLVHENISLTNIKSKLGGQCVRLASDIMSRPNY